MMKTIVDDLPGNSHADPTDAGLSQTAGQMTSAEGDSLRALRTIVFKHDPGRKFGGFAPHAGVFRRISLGVPRPCRRV
jgi:hypothetical protein